MGWTSTAQESLGIRLVVIAVVALYLAMAFQYFSPKIEFSSAPTRIFGTEGPRDAGTRRGTSDGKGAVPSEPVPPVNPAARIAPRRPTAGPRHHTS